MRDGGFQRGVGGSQPQTSPGQRPFSITEGSPPGMLVPASHEGQVGGKACVTPGSLGRIALRLQIQRVPPRLRAKVKASPKTAGDNSNQAVTVARAGVDPIPSNPSRKQSGF